MAFFNPQPVNSNGLVASLIAKVCNQNGLTGQIARLHRITATNTSGSVIYVQVFDSATVPADGAVPLMSFPLAVAPAVGSSTQPPIDLGVYGRTFQNGIVIVSSSTETTKTITSAVAFFDLLVS